MNDFKIKRVNPLCIVAMERLYLKADRKTICREGDPDAASLLAAAGAEIPIKTAARLGLVEDPGKQARQNVTIEKTMTISPEGIEARSTRPAEPPKKR